MNLIKKRLFSILDALSQLCNVSFFPRIDNTDPNESISSRSYREGVAWRIKFIDFMFSWYEKEHCRRSFEKDYRRASYYVSVNEPLYKNPRKYNN
jgi:hypothetical protein